VSFFGPPLFRLKRTGEVENWEDWIREAVVDCHCGRTATGLGSDGIDRQHLCDHVKGMMGSVLGENGYRVCSSEERPLRLFYRQAASSSVPRHHPRAQPYALHELYALQRRKEQPISAPQARTFPSTNSREVSRCSSPFSHSSKTFHSRYQAQKMDVQQKSISKDEVIAASKRHPRPDHAFQYGTAGVSSLPRPFPVLIVRSIADLLCTSSSV
jgi:hypothetical protein